MDIVSLARQLGGRVREQRRALSLTQKQLAEKSGVSERLIRSLEMGEAHGISLDKLAAVLLPLSLELVLADSLPSPEPSAQEAEYSALLTHAVRSWSAEKKGENE